MKKMSTYSFDFIDCDETRNATIIVYNIIIQNNLLIWASKYTSKCYDNNQQLVAELASEQGINGILMGGSIMRVATVAKDGYHELEREWYEENK
jgi:hypothetical protein